MIRIREAIIVEGRYDKNTLAQIVDAPILETSGFGIFHDRQRLALLRRLAETRGIIVLTDSDGAGFVIRNYLRRPISRLIINEELCKGKNLEVGLDEQNELTWNIHQ